MGMKEPPARKGNAASKGQQPVTDQTDKKIGRWKGGALGGDAGHSDKRLGVQESRGAVRENASKESAAQAPAAGSREPGARH